MILVARYSLMLALAIGVLVCVLVAYPEEPWRHWLALTGVVLFAVLVGWQVRRMRGVSDE